MLSLALVMIVRDEARCLERCLASALPWVDEAVVVDTGSTDATREIAQRLGARVHEMAWGDDFAAARNAALALTEAPWRLVLDADEWISAGGQALRALREQAPDFIGRISVVSAVERGPASPNERPARVAPAAVEHGAASPAAPTTDPSPAVDAAPSWLPRVLPAGVRYAGRIHEQPQSTLPRRGLPLVVAHDGYLGAQRERKAGRNEQLLGLALAESPDDPYLHYQLGKEHETRGRFAAAAPCYARALAGRGGDAAWHHDLVVRSLFTLKKLGRHDEAIGLATAEQRRWQSSPDFFFALGDVLLDCAASAPARAGELLPRIEASWRRALAIGERPDLQDTVHGRGSWLAAHNLAVLHETLGRTTEAARWRAEESALRHRHRASAP